MPFRRTYGSDRAPAADVRERDEAYDDRYEEVTREPRVEATPWSPAQIVGLIVGIGFTVLGVVALVRTGFHTDHIYTPKAVVWHLSHSPLLALCEIGFGVLMILASVVPGGSRTLMGVLGAIALVFGILILVNASQSDFQNWFGVTHRNGWLYTITGAVVLLSALLSPVFLAGGTASRRRVRSVRSGVA